MVNKHANNSLTVTYKMWICIDDMWTWRDFHESPSDCETSKFLNLFMSKWNTLHDEPDIFRYKINNLEEKLVDGKYLLQLNPDRQSKRRIPEDIKTICQPFDSNKFNFNKVSSKEILFSIEGSGDSDIHTFLVNVSPISKYHSLLCPSINEDLPQVVTEESLFIAIEIMFLMGNRDVKVGFNSLCALASVNHLHYHIFVEKNVLPVEKIKWVHITNHLHILDKEYPVPAFCFEVPKQCSTAISKDIYRLIQYFLKRSIAHNILLTRRKLEDEKEAVYVIVWPRKSTEGVKQLAAFNVAVLELSGWFPVYDAEDYNNLQSQDLEKELRKWRIDDFDKLCEEVKCLYLPQESAKSGYWPQICTIS